ncbi:MAG: ribbon-helix-helix protein, CopG family [Acidimicrobiia bacterium]|nr:ribbon-helix-helix protein, CopG family [Acidimicrobiia bacterium]
MMLRMRTTLTLDDDLAATLRERARLTDQSFKQVVNDALRRGLSPGLLEPRPTYKVRPHTSGLRIGVDPLRLNQLNDSLQAEAATHSRFE